MSIGIVCDENTGDAQATRKLDMLDPLCDLGIHRLSMNRSVGLRDWLNVRRISSVCREMNPHILHGHGAKGGAFARLIAHSVGARSVYTPHGGTLHYSAHSLSGVAYFSIERALRARTDAIIFESRFAETSYLEKIGSARCLNRVIPNGLNDDEFDTVPLRADAYDFVFVGEIRKLKGLRTLLDSLMLLRDAHDYRLLMVGDGPDSNWCARQVRKRDLGQFVDMVPPIYPGRIAFSHGRCVVVPSLHESFPYVVLEASGSGKPMIASNAGGISEILGPRANALVPPGDPGALASAMKRFLDDPVTASDDADEMRAYVNQSFSAEKMARNTIELYLEIGG